MLNLDKNLCDKILTIFSLFKEKKVIRDWARTQNPVSPSAGGDNQSRGMPQAAQAQ